MKRRLKKLAAALICTAIFLSVYIAGLFDVANSALLDRFFQKTTVPDPHIQVIGIDAHTIQELGTFTSWSRRETANLINVLSADPEAAPAVIAVDIIFEGESNEADDAALVAACEHAGNVILASQAVFAKTVEYVNGAYRFSYDSVESMMQPFPQLITAAKTGHVNTILDVDGVVRNALPVIETPAGTVESLSLAAAGAYAREAGCALYPPSAFDRGSFPIRYTAKPGSYYGGNSFVRVLRQEIPAVRFRDCIVFIGPFSAGMTDSYISAVDQSSLMHGVEIHANLADAMLHDRYYSDVPAAVQYAAMFFVLLACCLLFSGSSVQRSTITLLSALGLFAAAVWFCSKNGMRFDLLYLPVGLTASYVLYLIAGFVAERKRRARVVDTFKQYVAPSVVDGLLKNSEGELELVNSRRDIAVYFSDVRSFTALSEVLAPERIVEILDEYLSMITRIIFANGGTIDKFIGDGCMVLFNAPFDQKDYEYRAVKAAFEISLESRILSEKLKPLCGRDVMVGIGVHCGTAVVGNIGTAYRMDYTAIGDTVNIAARLESSAGAGEVIISEEMHNRLIGRISDVSVGALALKGKSQKMPCYRVTGLVEGEDRK